MKKILTGLAFSFTALFSAQKNDMNYYIENAPFTFGKLVLPNIQQKEYNFKDFGGIGDGKTLNTSAFKNAISTISRNGGGRLIVPAGIWLTGPIEMKSKIDFHTEEGAVIQFSSDIEQFPLRESSSGKYEVTPPIWGNDLRDISFTGKGIFDGSGDAWRPVKKLKTTPEQWRALLQKKGSVLGDDGSIWYPCEAARQGGQLTKADTEMRHVSPDEYPALHYYLRPALFALSSVTNLLIDGPTFRNSPKFALSPKQIINLVIRNTTVYNPQWAQNGDGIDISASKNVIVYNTKVNAGDDGICMKSSGTPKNGGVQLQNVIIAECTVNEGHGGFVIGSNTDGGIKNIFVSDCIFDGTDTGIRVKSNSRRGGDVSRIFIRNIEMKNIGKEAFIFDASYSDSPIGSTEETRAIQHTGSKIPYFHHFVISDISCSSAETAFNFTGLPEQPIEDLYFKDIEITSKKEIVGRFAKQIIFDGVKINNSINYKTDSNLKGAISIK